MPGRVNGLSVTRAATLDPVMDESAGSARARSGRSAPTSAGALPFNDAAPIVLPASTALGPDGVVTGYPRTAEGALAQLVAIDLAILKQPTHRMAHILRTWSAGGTDGQEVPFTALRDATKGSRGPVRASNSGARFWLMGNIRTSQPSQKHDVCLAVGLRQPQVQPAAVHCASMTWEHGHWAIQSGGAVEPAREGLRSLDDGIEVGFRLLQGSAAPDQR
ncbi:hypothetical protein [Kineosporia sp. NBRC 101677]|uniref:hypothetical protein n=1 Tax=Kineosporia sp. NBRC 101677 TaxID=3032197 RepID=UPI002553A0F9|nr:hypothetical protein [Kineosporia sp. NBRC 101677]